MNQYRFRDLLGKAFGILGILVLLASFVGLIYLWRVSERESDAREQHERNIAAARQSIAPLVSKATAGLASARWNDFSGIDGAFDWLVQQGKLTGEEALQLSNYKHAREQGDWKDGITLNIDYESRTMRIVFQDESMRLDQQRLSEQQAKEEIARRARQSK